MPSGTRRGVLWMLRGALSSSLPGQAPLCSPASPCCGQTRMQAQHPLTALLWAAAPSLTPSSVARGRPLRARALLCSPASCHGTPSPSRDVEPGPGRIFPPHCAPRARSPRQPCPRDPGHTSACTVPRGPPDPASPPWPSPRFPGASMESPFYWSGAGQWRKEGGREEIQEGRNGERGRPEVTGRQQ